jgi:hypothetical protein
VYILCVVNLQTTKGRKMVDFEDMKGRTLWRGMRVAWLDNNGAVARGTVDHLCDRDGVPCAGVVLPRTRRPRWYRHLWVPTSRLLAFADETGVVLVDKHHRVLLAQEVA